MAPGTAARCPGAFILKSGELDMFKTLTARLSIVAVVLALSAASASAAVATRTFTINTADIVDLYSATFDPALTPCPVVNPPQECTFFGGTPPVARAIVITPTGTGSGTMNVDYDTITGEILEVNTLYMNLPTLSLVITFSGVTTVTVTPGNNAPTTSPQDVPFIEAGTGTLGRDLDGSFSQMVLGLGTEDADQAPAIGQAAVFQHSSAPTPDAPDFSVFTDIVDNCVGPLCGLITGGSLSLDGVRYRLEGTIGCKSTGNSLILKTQTVNNSIYRVNLTAITTEADCDLDGDLNAADNCPDEPNADQGDTDSDLRGNVCDNCRTLANNTGAAAQCNSDGDAFGNRCDGDIAPGSGNNFTNAQDNTTFKALLGQPSLAPVYNKADINCNGFVNAQDNTSFKGLIGSPPGPGPGP